MREYDLSATDIGTQEDWYQGSRRKKHPPLGHAAPRQIPAETDKEPEL